MKNQWRADLFLFLFLLSYSIRKECWEPEPGKKQKGSVRLLADIFLVLARRRKQMSSIIYWEVLSGNSFELLEFWTWFHLNLNNIKDFSMSVLLLQLGFNSGFSQVEIAFFRFPHLQSSHFHFLLSLHPRSIIWECVSSDISPFFSGNCLWIHIFVSQERQNCLGQILLCGKEWIVALFCNV